MVMHQIDPRYRGPVDSPRPVPHEEVPIAQRTGRLRVVWAGQIRAYDYVHGERSYPSGLYIEPRHIVEVYLEVLPRSCHKSQYEDMMRRGPRMPTMTYPLLNLSGRTPLLISREAAADSGGWSRKVDSYVSFMHPDELRRHVVRLLPWLGVDAHEAGRITNRLLGQLPAGLEELREMEGRGGRHRR